MQKNSINRRDFMKLLAGGSLASMAPLAFMRQAHAVTPAFSDYKAMVCVLLHGGNDSFNMAIPTGTDAGKTYAEYANIRGDLAVTNNAMDLTTVASGSDLNNGNLGTGAANPYNIDQDEATAYLQGYYDLAGQGINLGINSIMPELAQLVTDNKVSLMSNVGTLVRPVTQAEIQAKTADLPLFLFAHDHQRRQLETGQATNLNGIGWAGKIADAFPGINDNSPLGLNLSYSGNTRLMVGNSSGPLILGTGTPPRYSEMTPNSNNSSDDRRALFRALGGRSTDGGNINFDSTNTYTSSDPFKNLYGSLLNRSMDTFDTLYTTFNNHTINYSATGPYGEPLFDVPSASDLGFGSDLKGKLINQLETVAKMIDIGAQNGFGGSSYNRQIFYVSLGGFDTHANQATAHPLLLRELSLALWKFQKALEDLGHANKVATFTLSDFGRTLSQNGSGTDHAWGSLQMVMSGDGNRTAGNLNGGQMFGEVPNITLSGPQDYSTRGRMIPTLAQDQVNATLCDWFGVPENTIGSIFPNLSNFETSSGIVSSAYVDQMFVA